MIAVAYGANARTVKTGVLEARRRGVQAGFIRPITLWPFLDELFERDCRYVVCELNYDGQLVREVMRAAPDKRQGALHGQERRAAHGGRGGGRARGRGTSAGRMPELPYIWTEVR